MPVLEIPPRTLRASATDALPLWSTLALPPLSFKTPLAWCPTLVEWAAHSGRVRLETLTATPLELNWAWVAEQPGDHRETVRKRLEDAWKSEQAAAETQAQQRHLSFEWLDERGSIERYSGLESQGFVRAYRWDGRDGCLAVFSLAATGRRAYVAAALCPPRGTGLSSARAQKKRKPHKPTDGDEEGHDPEQVLRRVLRTIALTGAGEPLRVSVHGAVMDVPTEFRIEVLRAGEGQVFLEARTPERRLVLTRVGMADLRLAGSPAENVLLALAKQLLDRNEDPDPLVGKLADFGAVPEQAQTKKLTEKDLRHAPAFFREKRRLHIRAGDWVLRRLGRKWSGGAAVCAWVCPASRALWAICARCGNADHEAEAHAWQAGLSCHGRAEDGSLDWNAYVEAECSSKLPPPAPYKPKDAKDAPPEHPVIMRRKQLRFRVRPNDRVRLEASMKDAGGDLVYEAAPATGMLSKALRGASAPAAQYRRLALDPIGRRLWEIMAAHDGVTVGQLLAELSGTFNVHPVIMFPKLLLFLRTMGERRLVNGAPEEDSLPTALSTAPQT